jgi:hypothetical protein
VRSRGRHAQRAAPSLGVEVAGTIQGEGALDEVLEPSAGRNSTIISTAFSPAGPTVCASPGGVEMDSRAEDTLDSAADREDRAAEDVDALFLAGVDVKRRRRCPIDGASIVSSTPIALDTLAPRALPSSRTGYCSVRLNARALSAHASGGSLTLAPLTQRGSAAPDAGAKAGILLFF